MNVKPGDLARIVAGSDVGTIVEVQSDWQIVDGYHHWRVKSHRAVRTGVRTPFGIILNRATDFSCRDESLRPINGDAEAVLRETVDDVDLPVPA